MTNKHVGPRTSRRVPNQIKAGGPRNGRFVPATAKPISQDPRQSKTISLSDQPVQIKSKIGPRPPVVVPKSL